MKISHWTDAFKALPEAAQKARELFSPSVDSADAEAVEDKVVAQAPVITVETLENRLNDVHVQLDALRETLAIQQSEQYSVTAQVHQLSSDQARLMQVFEDVRRRIGYLFIFSSVVGVLAVVSLVVSLMRG